MIAATLTALSALTSEAAGQSAESIRDYYKDAQSPTSVVEALRTHHLQPGERDLKERRYEQAVGHAWFMLRIVPNHPQALILLVQTCELWRSAKCRVDEAFENAVAINPTAAGTYVAQGIYLHRSRHYAEAAKSYRRALEFDPDSVNAHYNLGLSYLETKQYSLANQHAQRAYALGAPLPGLRKRLEQARQWDPNAVPELQAQRTPTQVPTERQPEAEKK